jgi:pimeloyl-ACP methyl ester carboxylesterase
VGFHVLRFDYFGCGDSEGDFEQGSLVQWTKDIRTAIEEMQKRTGLAAVCLIGLRMGAILALKAAADCHSINGIILWEPIFNGNLHLKELADTQRDFSSQQRHKIKRANRVEMETPDEVLGFPITSGLRHELQMMNLDRLKLRSSVRLLVLSSGEESNRVSGLNQFIANHPHADVQVIADQLKVWKEFYKRLTPHKTLQYLVKWVDTVRS